MQYLKDTVKEKILAAAIQEFKEYGYLDSSIRRIAKRAGITGGNIYRYFANKEALFDSVINPIYEKFMEYMGKMEKEINDPSVTDISAHEYINRIYSVIVNLIKEYSSEFIILIDKSKGSKFESTKPDLILLLKRILRNKTFNPDSQNEPDGFDSDFTAFVVASTMVEGIAIILRTFDSYEDKDKIEFHIDNFICVYLSGLEKQWFSKREA